MTGFAERKKKWQADRIKVQRYELHRAIENVRDGKPGELDGLIVANARVDPETLKKKKKKSE